MLLITRNRRRRRPGMPVPRLLDFLLSFSCVEDTIKQQR